jgi:hypothetical protein
VCAPCWVWCLQASKRQHLSHVAHVGLVHVHSASQRAFAAGALLGEDVALEGLTAFDGATWAHTEALGSAFLGLHFGHVNAPFLLAAARRWQRVSAALVGLQPLLLQRRGDQTTTLKF